MQEKFRVKGQSALCSGRDGLIEKVKLLLLWPVDADDTELRFPGWDCRPVYLPDSLFTKQTSRRTSEHEFLGRCRLAAGRFGTRYPPNRGSSSSGAPENCDCVVHTKAARKKLQSLHTITAPIVDFKSCYDSGTLNIFLTDVPFRFTIRTTSLPRCGFNDSPVNPGR